MTADVSDLVVEILHYRSDDKNPYWSVGSGFFVGESLVLTALHNVDGQGELLVRIHGKKEHSAAVILPTDKDHKDMDLAVLKVSDVAVSVPSLRYGTVNRSIPAEVEQCWAIGFPEFKVLEHEHGKPKPSPTTVQIKGKIPTCECLGQQRLTLRAEINPRPSSEGSEWAGMSGAVVFADNDIVVGVITEHHLPEGESALNVVPITAIDNLLPSTEAAKWWQLLGVDRQKLVSLPDMNGSIRHENSTSYIKDFRPIIDPKDSYVLLSHDSPFHPYGTLPLKNQSYITRDCDRQLKEHLQNNSFICLHGNFCSGKSSLLIRVPEMLSKTWNVYQPHIDLYSCRRRGSLERNFFIELQRENKDIRDWVFISDLLKRANLVLLIDEIGRYSSQDVKEFIERLYALVDHVSPDHIRIVLTLPISLDSYIEKIGLDNPKYYDRWQVVEITDFNEEELIKMLDIFPHPVADSLKRSLSLIQNYTLMKPNEVQKFCERLWNYLRINKIPMMEINQKIQCYFEDLEKV